MSIRTNRVDRPEETQAVAVIGMSCRFPGAESVDDYWHLLANGVDAITEVPADRWDVAQFYDPDLAAPGKMNTRWGGFLSQVDQFDPLFFGISPREAVQMDPQQRLMLELSWEALASAGLDTDPLRESATGVFFGASWSDYATLHHKDGTDYIAQHTATGTHFSILANRVSYIFGLRGPSMVIDTACSSSLVAVHQACQSLRSGESVMALAGGVHLMLAPDSTMMMSKFGGLSPDGRCRTFDARANGFVRGEGGGVVVLKLLAQAVADQDPIFCVIRGSAVNNDGRDTGMTAVQRILTAAREIRAARRQEKKVNPGLTVPNTAAQEAVLRAACRQAGIAPGDVQYVEAHGTGTPLGDPIEAKALSAVYCDGRSKKRPLRLGSVKTNIGHMEAAAGVGGLIKVALALKHRQIPPNLHFAQPNPNIPFDSLNLRVQTALTPWPQPDADLMAGVSSFGFGGTNCHLILAAPPVSAALPTPSTGTTQAAPLLLSLSARSAEAREEVVHSIHVLLHARPNLSLSDLCYTAGRRSSHHPYRLAVAFAERDELIESLAAFGRGEEMKNLVTGHAASIPPARPVFVFSGQGPQWWAMGRELFMHEPVYRAVIEACDRLLSQYADWSLIVELMAAEHESRLAQTAVAQPALFALQIALAALWQSWGIEAGAVVGHSVGEVAAAYVAGCLTLEQAICVIYHRGRLMQAAAGLGKMAAVDLSSEAATALMNGTADRLAIAAVNSPDALTLSGEAAALELLLAKLDAADIFYRRLNVDYAFHSPQMAPFQQRLVQTLGDLQGQTAVIPIVSTVTGQFIEGEALDAAYWGRNIRETVQFDTAVTTLIHAGSRLFIEIGPHPALSTYITRRLEVENTSGHVLPSLRRYQPDRMTMLASLAHLYTVGYPVVWDSLCPTGQVVALPSYPWQRERYWLPTVGHQRPAAAHSLQRDEHALLGRRLRSPLLQKGTAFESMCSLAAHPFLDDHRLYGAVVVPGAHHLSLILSAVQAHLGSDRCRLSDVTFTQVLALAETAGRLVQVILTPTGPDRFTFEIHSCEGDEGAAAANQRHDEWMLHATGEVSVEETETAVTTPPAVATVRARCPQAVSGREFYREFHAAGYHLGPRFQWLEQIWRREGEAVARLRLPETADRMALFQLPPGLIDSLFQFLCVTLPEGGVATILRTGDIYIPLGIDAFHVYGRFSHPLWCHAQLRPRQENAEIFVGDVQLVDDAGRIVVDVKGLHFKRAPQTVLLRDAQPERAGGLYEVEWQPKPTPSPTAELSQTSWLIFSDGDEVSERLIAELNAAGQPCVVVASGAGPAQLDGIRWQLDPARPEQFVHCLQAADSSTHILYGWGLTAVSPTPGTAADLAAAQGSCRGLLYLVQALARLPLAQPPRLWIVTQGAQRVTAVDAPLNVAHSPLWGLGRVIALEHPEVWGGLVDAAPTPAGANALLHHILAADGEDQAAVRQGQRYVARLVRSQSRHPVNDEFPVRADGTYLITGGLGGLGLLCARWLVQQGAQHLLLLGRRPPAPAAAAAVKELTDAGAQVVMMQADVTEADQITAVFARLSAEMPPLRGVIHAAGVLHDGILMNQAWPHFERVLAPKVAGAWNLHVQTQDLPLDFFILFSSISALLGSAGQGNYAAANAFLDALAQARRQQGLPAVSVNWGPWAAAGMADALNEAHKQRWLAQGIEMISPEQGLSLLAQTLEYDAPQVGAFSIDWETFSQRAAFRSDWVFLSEFTAAAPQPQRGETAVSPPFLAELQRIPPDKKKEALLLHVQQQVGKVLGMRSARRLDPQKRLFEMGLDSLMAVELQKRLQVSLAARLSKTLVFDYPTVQFLTDYLAQAVLDLSVEKDDAPASTAAPEPARLQREIEALSEAEAEALLLAELDETG